MFQPSDLVNQSIPLSYSAVSVAPNDAGSHSVQIYMDISGEWLGATSLVANWSTSTGDVITHQQQLQSQSMFTESNDRILRQLLFSPIKNCFITFVQRDRSSSQQLA